MSKKPLVYLSGMMDGVSKEDGNGWRQEAAQILRESGFDVFNPYEKHGGPKENYTANEIYNFDIYWLDKSDIILANLNLPETIKNKDIPFFTIGELFLGYRCRKPIISYTNCLNGRFGYDAIVTKNASNLEECLDYIIKNFQ
jgi:nucleoside 2-deoxyribosyltransferase